MSGTRCRQWARPRGGPSRPGLAGAARRNAARRVAQRGAAGRSAAARRSVARCGFGGDPTLESYFMDTAVDVAEQSAATFLGVDTSEVCRVLRESKALLSSGASPSGSPPEVSEDKDMIIRAFEEFDSKWSSGLTKDHMCSILCSLQPGISSGDVERLLASMHLGDSERIDYHAFIAQLFSELA